MGDRSRGKFAEWAWLSAVLVSLVILHGSVWAQEDEAPAEPAAAPAATTPAAEPNVKQEFLLFYVIKASPVFFVIFLLMSGWLVYLIVDGFMKLRVEQFLPPAFQASLDALLQEKKYKEAYELAKGDPSLLARGVSAGVERLSQGYDRGVESMMNTFDDGKLAMEHRYNFLSTLATLGPLVGLFGTVLGMIFAFQEIGSGGQVKPEKLAGDIGLALVTTFEGLVVAIIAIFFYSFFRNTMARLLFDLESVGENFLIKFAGALKK